MDDDFYIDSSCSTPYVSAPSSPGRTSSSSGGGGGFFYSAPASPMHFILSSAKNPAPKAPEASVSTSSTFEFELSNRFPSTASADELFLNGQIRPMKLSSHLQRPQILSPLIDLDESGADLDNLAELGEKEMVRGREELRDKSPHRRTRSLSPLRNTDNMTWHEIDVKSEKEIVADEETPSMSASSSRSSSTSRSSKRWISLKEFLYRSKSEGRNNSHKFWNNFSFSPVKEKLFQKNTAAAATSSTASTVTHLTPIPVEPKKKKATPTNGVGKRRVPASPHEIHYRANRAQAEEMRKKTFLPYRQGLIGCLGFSSKSYGAVNGLARALNPVSSM